MEFTKEEVMKALECCSGTTCKTSCPLSPIREVNCGQLLINASLSLIKELTEENEKLNAEIADREMSHINLYGEMQERIKHTKVDTVLKMQDLLKRTIHNYNGYYLAEDIDGDIAQVVAEMLGDSRYCAGFQCDVSKECDPEGCFKCMWNSDCDVCENRCYCEEKE